MDRRMEESAFSSVLAPGGSHLGGPPTDFLCGSVPTSISLQSHSVNRILRDDIKPTISPALLTVVESSMHRHQDEERSRALHDRMLGHEMDTIEPTALSSAYHLSPSEMSLVGGTLKSQDLDPRQASAAQTLTSLRTSDQGPRGSRGVFIKLEQPTIMGHPTHDASSLGLGPYSHPSLLEQPQIPPPNFPFMSGLMESSGNVGSDQAVYTLNDPPQMLSLGQLRRGPMDNHPDGENSLPQSPEGNLPRPFPCDECGKRFQNNSALVKHKLIHSEERRFVCELCNKAFKRQDHLTGHLNVHKSVKPFQCIIEGCEKSYCDGRSLRRHLEHGHNIKNPVVHSQKGTMYVKCGDNEEYRVPMRTSPVTVTKGSGGTAMGSMSGSDRQRNSSGETNNSSSSGSQDVSPGGISGSSNSGSDRLDRGTVVCTHCGRNFKNMPALNGHMRLHSSVHRERAANAAASAAGSVPSNPTAQTPPALLNQPPLMPDLRDAGPESLFNHHGTQALYNSRPHHLMGLNGSTIVNQTGAGAVQVPVHEANGHFNMGLATSLSSQAVADLSQNTFCQPHHPSHDMFLTNTDASMARQETEPALGVPQRMDLGTVHGTSSIAPTEPLTVTIDGLDVVSNGQDGFAGDSEARATGPTLLSATASASHPGSPSAALQPSSIGAADHGLEDLSELFDRHQHEFVGDDEAIQKELDALSGCFPDLSVFPDNTHPDYGGSLFPSAEYMSSESYNVRKRHPTAPSALAIQKSASEANSPTGVFSHTPARRRPVRYRGKPDNICQLMEKNAGSYGGSHVRKRSTGGIETSLSRRYSCADSGDKPHKQHGRPSCPAVLPISQQRSRVKSKSGNPNIGRIISPRSRTKPPPLCLPPAGINLVRYSSQMRSPRIWDTPSDGSSGSPPPYTPPPILSPLRQSSGLFWTINKHLSGGWLGAGLNLSASGSFMEGGGFSMMRNECPKSAPIAPSRIFWGKQPLTSALSNRERNRSIEDKKSLESSDPFDPSPVECFTEPAIPPPLPAPGTISRRVSIVEPLENRDQSTGFEDEIVPVPEEPPETDLTPHINIGPTYQACIDNFADLSADTSDLEEKAELIFSPESINGISSNQIASYLDFACSQAVSGSGRNPELALHLLHLKAGNIEEAMLTLMNCEAVVDVVRTSNGLRNYEYVDTSYWSPDEVKKFQESLFKVEEKDFFKVAALIESKSAKECISFYYMWKKSCPDEYKKLRNIRRRKALDLRNQTESYNLRSTKGQTEAEGVSEDQDTELITLEEVDSRASSRLTDASDVPFGDQAMDMDWKPDLAGLRDGLAGTPHSNTSSPFKDDDSVIKRLPQKPPRRPVSNTAGRATPDANGLFVCRLCGKGFEKVKSRNAHMKSHSMKGEK